VTREVSISNGGGLMQAGRHARWGVVNLYNPLLRVTLFFKQWQELCRSIKTKEYYVQED
jgi:hypothetical protein